MKNSLKQWATLAVFFLIVLCVGYFNSLFTPDQWYRNLNQAPWTPPGWAFGLIWSILYILIAISGWLLWLHKAPLFTQCLWWAQLICNGLWSWLFFGLHSILSLLDISVLWLILAALLIATRTHYRQVFWLTMPYLIWITLATSLNLYIVMFNA